MVDEVTKAYFETYLEVSLSGLRRGELRVAASERRRRKEEGWSRPFAIWFFLLGDRGVASVRPDLKDAVTCVTTGLADTRDVLADSVQRSVQAACGLEFRVFNVDILSCGLDTIRIHSCPGLRRLTELDVESYLTFKQVVSPNCDLACCRRDILRNIADGCAFGVFQNDKVVSEASAPHIGVMQDRIEEPGPDTLPEYRRRGYAKAVLSHTTKAILELDRVPIYRLSKANLASLRTAQSVGYRRIAETVRFVAEER